MPRFFVKLLMVSGRARQGEDHDWSFHITQLNTEMAHNTNIGVYNLRGLIDHLCSRPRNATADQRLLKPFTRLEMYKINDGLLVWIAQNWKELGLLNDVYHDSEKIFDDLMTYLEKKTLMGADEAKQIRGQYKVAREKKDKKDNSKKRRKVSNNNATTLDELPVLTTGQVPEETQNADLKKALDGLTGAYINIYAIVSNLNTKVDAMMEGMQMLFQKIAPEVSLPEVRLLFPPISTQQENTGQ